MQYGPEIYRNPERVTGLAGRVGAAPGWRAVPMGLSSPASLTARSVLVLHGADDAAEQGGELVLLALGQAGADQRLARVERGEQPLDDLAGRRLQRHQHQPAVLVVPAEPGQAALLQRL